MTDEVVPGAERRQLLRHTVATLAYRAEKVLRDVPDGFATMRVSENSRTPLEILAHLFDLADWAGRFPRGERRWVAGPMPSTWAEGVALFQGSSWPLLRREIAAQRQRTTSIRAVCPGAAPSRASHVTNGLAIASASATYTAS